MTDIAHVPDQRAGGAAAAVTAYLDAWNAHDGAAVAQVVTGTYVDPTLPGPVSGDAIAGMVDGLVAAFPDLRFVTEDVLVAGETVTAKWRMQGTNDGAPLPGAPAPTGGTIDLAGVDVITTSAGRVVDVVGYFDQKTFVEQLGIQALMAPADEWPVSWGVANRVDIGHTTVPGAITFTWIDTEHTGELQSRTQDIVTALASEPGFIGFRGLATGNRFATLTLWTSPEAAETALARNAPHNKAMDHQWSSSFGSRGFTSIWSPYRVNRQFVMCEGCGRPVGFEAGQSAATCECGVEVAVSSYL